MTTLRDAHAELTRERLLDAAVALIRKGAEPTLRAVGQGAGVAERTVYRYFPDRDALATAVGPRLQGVSGIPLCDDAADLEAYAAALFSTFEKNSAFVRMLLTTPWMTAPFRRTRAGNLKALRKLVDAAHPRARPADRAAATSTLRAVLSGSGWFYLRDSCGLSNADCIAHAQWLVRTVRKALRT